MLKQACPSLSVSPELAWHFLQDMTDDELREATTLIIQNLAEVYPSTNWIAMLHTARQKWCRDCHGTGRYESSNGYDRRCSCRER